MWGAQNIDAEVNNSVRPPFAGCSKNTQETTESNWKIPKKVCAHECAHRADRDNPRLPALALLYFTFFILLNCPSDLKLTLKAQGAARDQTPY